MVSHSCTRILNYDAEVIRVMMYLNHLWIVACSIIRKSAKIHTMEISLRTIGAIRVEWELRVVLGKFPSSRGAEWCGPVGWFELGFWAVFPRVHRFFEEQLLYTMVIHLFKYTMVIVEQNFKRNI